MANKNSKFLDNISGAYYVDEDCISCDTCAGFAPANFRLTDTHDHAIVYAQPKTVAEKIQCEKALGACPVRAIGNDG